MTNRQKAAIIKGERQRNEWNSLHPVGTRVRYWPLIGQQNPPPVEGVTRSKAWCLGYGDPVVLITGKAGGMSLDHLEILP